MIIDGRQNRQLNFERISLERNQLRLLFIDQLSWKFFARLLALVVCDECVLLLYG